MIFLSIKSLSSFTTHNDDDDDEDGLILFMTLIMEFKAIAGLILDYDTFLITRE